MTTRSVIMNKKEMALAIKRISLQILESNYDIENMAIVGIHTCGVFLAKRIVSKIQEISDKEMEYGSLDITLYRDDWSLISQNPLVKTTEIPFVVDGRDIILVDDVLFTGRTIRAAMDALNDFGRPRSIQLVTLVDRGGRELPIQPDYKGFTTEIRPYERIYVVMEEQGERDEVYIDS